MTPAPPDHDRRETSVQHAVDRARRHLNVGVARRVVCAALIAGGGVALALAAGYWWAGHRVATWVYAAAAAVGAAVLLAGWWTQRHDDARAARKLDDAFDLADGVRTARALTPDESADRAAGFAALQQRWTRRALAGLPLETLRPATPRWLVAGAVTLPTLAVLLGFSPPSQAVLDQQREAAEVLALGETLNEGIRDELARHLDEADDLEREALDPASLEQLAERLGVSEDRAELMRQYATMEQKLAQRSQALQQQRAEALMNDAAARLGQTPSTMALAEALRQKRYEDAAELLRKMQPDADADPATQRRQLQTLRAAASQLGQASKNFRAGSGNAGGGGQSNADLADELATLSEQLDDATRQYDETLERAERRANRNELNEQQKRELQKSQGQCQAANQKLQRSLCKLGACRSASQRLAQMRRTLSQCQGACAGTNPNPFAQNGSGVGSGSVDSRNDTATPNGGQLDAITGIKGAGPSQTQVEEASSGTGASGRRAAATSAEHARQLESFVQRPDVPDELKQGVKTYFETLHQSPDNSPETLAP